MKQLEVAKEIHKGKEGHLYVEKGGLNIWDVTIDAGVGEEVYIGLISDVHLNYCNAEDMEDADPVLMSTYKNRKWCANGETVPKLRRCIDMLSDADRIVANGDIMDYLSKGCMELIEKELWVKVPDVIANVGGHEFCIRMQGEVEEVLSYEERVEIIRNFWRQDIDYVSSLVKDRVLLIAMNDDRATLTAKQRDLLEADLNNARDNGYTVLIFVHEPFRTCNPAEDIFEEDRALLVGDGSGFPKRFFDGYTRGNKMVGAEECDEVTNSVYNLIVNSADVIKAVFGAHFHSDIYTEIIAKTKDGEEAVIPQYIHTATAYDNGHLMRISVK